MEVDKAWSWKRGQFTDVQPAHDTIHSGAREQTARKKKKGQI